MSNNYKNFNDIFDMVFLRPTSQLNTIKSLTISFQEDNYEYDDEVELGLLSSIIIPSVDLSIYRNKNITLINNGPDALNEIFIQTSPNNVDWETIDSSISNLPTENSKSIAIIDCRKYYRVIGNSSGTSTVKCYLYGFII